VLVRVQAPNFDSWWRDAKTWAEDPMQQIFDRLDEGAAPRPTG